MIKFTLAFMVLYSRINMSVLTVCSMQDIVIVGVRLFIIQSLKCLCIELNANHLMQWTIYIYIYIYIYNNIWHLHSLSIDES